MKISNGHDCLAINKYDIDIKVINSYILDAEIKRTMHYIFIAKLTIEQTAEVMCCCVTTVKNRIQQGLTTINEISKLNAERICYE